MVTHMSDDQQRHTGSCNFIFPLYIFMHTHTHTHTHIYIYIYIGEYIENEMVFEVMIYFRCQRKVNTCIRYFDVFSISSIGSDK